MRLSFALLTFFIGLSWCQQTQIESSLNSGSGRISIPGNSGRLVDVFLHPLRPFLGEAGHKALHNALEVIPMSVLNQVSNLGQLFGALITFNPTAIPRLINLFFPGASSLFGLLPSFGTAGLGALTSLTRSADNLLDGPNSNSLNNRFFGSRPSSSSSFSSQPPNSFSTYSSSDVSSPINSPSFRETYIPANIASDMVRQGLSNFPGTTNNLADGQPLSALLTMTGGPAYSFNGFDNLASSGLDNRISNTDYPWDQNSPFSPPRDSPPEPSPSRPSPPRDSPYRPSPPGTSTPRDFLPGPFPSRPSPPRDSPPGPTPRPSPPRTPRSTPISPRRTDERNTDSFSSPLTSLFRANPFTAFLTGR